MAVMKRVYVVVQEWLENSNHLQKISQECEFEKSRMRAMQMRQFYF
jgi:hypothetical protein